MVLKQAQLVWKFLMPWAMNGFYFKAWRKCLKIDKWFCSTWKTSKYDLYARALFYWYMQLELSRGHLVLKIYYPAVLYHLCLKTAFSFQPWKTFLALINIFKKIRKCTKKPIRAPCSHCKKSDIHKSQLLHNGGQVLFYIDILRNRSIFHYFHDVTVLCKHIYMWLWWYKLLKSSHARHIKEEKNNAGRG